jgi:hypothetical protein
VEELASQPLYLQPWCASSACWQQQYWEFTLHWQLRQQLQLPVCLADGDRMGLVYMLREVLGHIVVSDVVL